MGNYNVVRTDRMTGTQVDSQLRSFKYLVGGTTETAIENGNVVIYKGLIEGEREVYSADTPAANTPLSKVLLVASPELLSDPRLRNLSDFRNEAGDVCRGYRIVNGDTFGVTVGCFNNTEADAPIVGDIVELTGSTKFSAVTALTSGSTKVGEIIAIEPADGVTYYVVENR